MPGKSAKKPVRKVNPNAGKRSYKLTGESTRDRDQAAQSMSERRKTAGRARTQQKRDAMKRGAEGPKRRSR